MSKRSLSPELPDAHIAIAIEGIIGVLAAAAYYLLHDTRSTLPQNCFSISFPNWPPSQQVMQ